MDQQELYKLIAQPGLFNYVQYLSEATDEKLRNTVELFAYGTVEHYEKYRHKFIELDATCLQKLVCASLLTLLSENIGNTLKQVDILAKLRCLETPDALEDLLISMVDANCVSVKIDRQKCTVAVLDVAVLRDAYSNDITLRVLQPHEVQSASVAWARQVIRAWIDQKIVPAQLEVQSQM